MRPVPSLLAILCIVATPTLARDWPAYRGPNHDGVSTETIRTNWTAQPPTVVWRRAMEPGFSTFSVQNGRAFTMVNRNVSGGREFAVALDANTGQELWATDLDAADYSGGTGLPVDGPRATPAVKGDFVFYFTAHLRLACLRVADGGVVWSRDFVDEFSSSVISWQNAASPMLVGDLVVVNCNAPSGGRLTAVRQSDGTQVWRRHSSESMTQSSPVLATIGGTQQLIFFTQAGLLSIVPETGDVLWRHAITYNGTSVAASPVVAGDRVYASRAYPTRAGALAVTVQGSGTNFTVTSLWNKANQLMNHWATPVFVQDHFYGLYGSGNTYLQCVEAATGTSLWQVRGFGMGSIVSVGGHLLGTTDDGVLVLVEPNPTAYREIDRFQAVDAVCWNVPAISDGRIFVRGMTEAACLDVSVAAPFTPLRLEPQVLLSGTGFRFRVTHAEGGTLPPDRLNNVEILATSDPSLPLTNWARLTLSPLAVSGGFELEDPQATNASQRYYLLQEP